MFKMKKKRTSSDTRRLNYTLWKALAQSNFLSSVLSIMISLPFTYGFVNDHWTKMTDFMIEKKPGVRHIHKLRIIGKVAAEFNTTLSFLIGKKTAQNYESCDPCNEQHGSRPHMGSPDAAIIKLLTFECARVQRANAGYIQHDCSAHFDRIYPEHTSVFASKYGVDERFLTCIAKTVDAMERHVETGLGISKQSYGNRPGAPRLNGMVQGKVDVPQLATHQSDVCMKAHKMLAPGLTIQGANPARRIEHHNVATVDDTDGHASGDPLADDVQQDIAQKVQRSGQIWNNVIELCGALPALHKTNWQMSTWQARAGQLEMIRATDEEVRLSDGKGGHAVIPYKRPDQPNVGLGFHLCPDGNQEPHHKETVKAITGVCNSCVGAHLTEDEAHRALYQHTVPKLRYKLHTTTWNAQQCHDIDTMLRRTFIPPMKFNRHYPGAVLYGLSEHGGLEYPNVHILQDQVQLEYVLKQLRWGHTVANDFLTTLDSLQLRMGLVTPLLESTKANVDYAGTSWILDIRRRLSEMDAAPWIEDKWTPRLQRQRDASLMEAFARLEWMTPLKLERLNSVRLYLRVVTIADLADEGGTYIPDGMLCGDWQAGSDLHWPAQPCPPKTWWALFRKSLRHSFCTGTSPYQKPDRCMYLDTKLGKWYDVPHNTWYRCYRSADCLYYRGLEDRVLQRFKQTSTSGLYAYDANVESVPDDCHPVPHQIIGEKVWTQKPHTIIRQRKRKDLEPGHQMTNTIHNLHTENIVLGSDGSVHIANEAAAAAWIIHAGPDEEMQAVVLTAGMTSLSAYRTELEGVFRCLKHVKYLGLTHRDIKQWCDNKQAVISVDQPIYSPAGMVGADADIVLAIHHLISNEEWTHQIRHVYAHQDTREAPSKAKLQRMGLTLDSAREKEATAAMQPLGTSSDAEATASATDDSDTESEAPASSTLDSTVRVDPTPTPATAPPSPYRRKRKVRPVLNPYVRPKKKKLSKEARLNIKCDELASGMTSTVIPHTFPTIRGI